MKKQQIILSLPDWVGGFVAEQPQYLESDEEKILFAIELSRQNVLRGSGGPFGAAIFEETTGKLVSAGVNVVVPAHCSLAHGEMMAIGLAQQALGSHDLGAPGLARHVLATSTEPCAMCLGAIVWSGLRRVICGARDGDARAIGFDEGPKIDDWIGALACRGIGVRADLQRAEAIAVLQAYGAGGGEIYGGKEM